MKATFGAALNSSSKDKGRIDAVKVNRFWRNKGEDSDDEADDAFFGKAKKVETSNNARERSPTRSEGRAHQPSIEEKIAAVVVKRNQAPVQKPKDDEDNDDEIEDRRARMRRLQKQRQQQQQEEQEKEDEVTTKENTPPRSRVERSPSPPPVQKLEVEQDQPMGEDPEEEEDESEDESSESEDERVMMKPVFVPKSQRVTQEELKRREEEELKRQEEQKRQQEERKAETQQIVKISTEKLEQEAAIADAEDQEMPDDDDTIDEEKEMLAWREREKARIKRERAEREKIEFDKAEKERRRHMTDEEIRKEDEEFAKSNNVQDKFTKEKTKWKYMQRYYHKGAFFMDTDDKGQAALGEIVRRDYGSAPTLEDHYNRDMLPKVMQKKKFGMSSQTKYTHLLDQDTIASNKDSAWASKDVSEREKQRIEKKGQIERPNKRRK